MYNQLKEFVLALAQGTQKDCPPRDVPPPIQWPKPAPTPGPATPGTAPSLGASSELLLLLFYLAIALLILFALYYLFRWSMLRQTQPGIPTPGEPSRAKIPDLLQAAETQASQGNYRLALRYLYTAVLIHLDRLGFLHYEPTNTDWEHLNALRGTLHDQLLPITELVQRKWYGLEAAAPEDFQRARQATQLILARHEAV